MAKEQRQPIPPLEWAAAALGLLIAFLLLLIIGREALDRQNDAVPVLMTEVERIAATPTGHIVEFRIRNRSKQTAASVQVEGKIDAGSEQETSSATVDYVPGRSQARGGLMFSSNPRRGVLKLRVTGYELP